MSLAQVSKARPATYAFKSRADIFVSRIPEPGLRKEITQLTDLMSRVTKLPAKMWGPNVVGFGRYKYETPSGHESEFAITGVSPKKRRIAIYLNPGYEDFEEELDALGKFERGQGCIMVRKVKDIDLGALEKLVSKGLRRVKKKYETWED